MSDLHFGHKDIINFERTQFKTVEEHDQYIEKMISTFCRKLKPGDEVWNLGDFGSLNYLYIVDWIKNTGAKAYFIYGNHDKHADLQRFEHYFDQVFFYPVFLSQRLIISHYPVATFPDTINIHGHLHSSQLYPINYINASIHVAKYHPIAEKSLDSIYVKLPKFTRRFMYEPFAAWYQFTQPKEDVIMDKDNIIDLSASRMMQYFNTRKRIQENSSYQPYHGEGDF